MKIFLCLLMVVGACGCSKLKEPSAPKPQSTQLVEAIRVQRHKLALIRSDIKILEGQLDEIVEELQDTEMACRLNQVAECSTQSLNAVNRDLEDGLQDAHEQLRIEGLKLDELISQLLH